MFVYELCGSAKEYIAILEHLQADADHLDLPRTIVPLRNIYEASMRVYHSTLSLKARDAYGKTLHT
jgi:hypothetical protein